MHGLGTGGMWGGFNGGVSRHGCVEDRMPLLGAQLPGHGVTSYERPGRRTQTRKAQNNLPQNFAVPIQDHVPAYCLSTCIGMSCTLQTHALEAWNSSPAVPRRVDTCRHERDMDSFSLRQQKSQQ